MSIPIETAALKGEPEVTVNPLYTAEQANVSSRINPTDLETEMVEVAGEYARWAQIAVEARRQRDAFKSRKSLVEARLDAAIRAEAERGGTKLTEARVASAVRMKPAYIRAESQLNEAEAILFGAIQVLEALSMKRDMLMQINKLQGREFDYQTTLDRSIDDKAARLAALRGNV